jgi:hypothetical protein
MDDKVNGSSDQLGQPPTSTEGAAEVDQGFRTSLPASRQANFCRAFGAVELPQLIRAFFSEGITQGGRGRRSLRYGKESSVCADAVFWLPEEKPGRRT